MKLGIRAKLFLVSVAVLVPSFVVLYTMVDDVVLSTAPHTAEIDAVARRLQRALFALFLCAVAVAFLLSTVAASIASRTARALAASARRLAEGDVGSLAVAHAEDEFGELGAALDQLANRYTAVLSDHARERDRLRGILTGMREGVLLLDRGRRVALVNPALREMLLLRADVQGKSPLEIIRHAELVSLLDQTEERSEPASGEIELYGLKPRRLLVHVVPIPGEEGGLLAVFVDVTHLRRLETLRRDFVANASHELRTPVAAIHSAVETLETAITRDPAGARDFLEIIARNALRLKNLVDDLLDLSRIESQDFEVRLESIEVAEVIDAVLDLFRERAQKKGIRLTREVEVPDLCVRADHRGLEHVLTNLVDNGVKYCGSGCTLRVIAEHGTEGRVRLLVADDGPGIEEHHLPRLFERFYRVDPGRSRQLGGTGLGLSIVKHIVEAMGGRIDVTSEPGKGTRFGVTLAVAPHVPLAARVTNPPPAA